MPPHTQLVVLSKLGLFCLHSSAGEGLTETGTHYPSLPKSTVTMCQGLKYNYELYKQEWGRNQGHQGEETETASELELGNIIP